MALPSTAADDHDARLKSPDGSWKYTNALADQTSPYLLQHAHNPVDWHPWGPAAFELARETGKPIFLSVGYSTCYWCHVMERQVFENPDLAEPLNEQFVSIKVDREERPDVDDIYMAAVQLITRHGGWPMSVFLTPPGAAGPDDPGLKPFWAGTYIPPEPAHGMPGFSQVVERIAAAWAENKEDVVAQAERIADATREHLTQRNAQGDLSPELIQAAANQLVRTYDPTHGGFGSGSQGPKFPQPASVAFLIAVHKNNPNPQLWTAIAYTLERMANGGMYDQVGGGFHRYSTDAQWLVPHFEKMLYDNGQLLALYADAHEVSPHVKDPAFYTRILRDTCEYVLREMTAEAGDRLFWSAQDAEVDAHEGLNYLWTEPQVREAIGDKKLADMAVVMYGLDRGTNFKDPHNPDATPANVLYLPMRLDKLAEQRGVDFDELLAARERINAALLAARGRREQPLTDDKALVSWNGMMIAGLARAGRLLDEPRYTQAAAGATEDVLELMRDERGHLLRTRRHGESRIPAFLEDYAYFAHGLIELHRATDEDHWLTTAQQIMETADRLFAVDADPGGGYYDTLADQSDLFVRTITTYDGAIPSGNSRMVHNLLDLHELTGNQQHLDRAITNLRAFAGALEQYGAGMAHMQHALLRAMEAAPRLVDTGGAPSEAAARPPRATRAVEATISPVTVAPGDLPATLQLTITIRDGYHINAAEVTEDWLIPTAVRLEGAPGWTVNASFPEATARTFPFADQRLQVYEGRLPVEVHLDLGAERGTSTPSSPSDPRLVLSYQACTDTACLEPTSVEIPIRVTGRAE